MSKSIKKRDFLKLLMLAAVPGTVSRAEAISVLDHLKRERPNKFEEDLMQNPRKQILLAEKMSCVFTPVMKAKCIAEE